MMSTFFFYLLLLLMLLYGGVQTTHTPPRDPAESIGVSLSAPFTLGWGHPAAVGPENLIVVFDMIASDARCPEGMECAASGPVAVALTVHEQSGETAHIVLSAHTDPQGAVAPLSAGVVVSESVLGHVITLLKVAPYPHAGDVTPKDDYAIELRVDPAPSGGEQPATSATLTTPFTLAPREQIELAGTGLRIGVTSIGDTRCPVDMECGAAGGNVVEVSLRIEGADGKAQQVKLAARTDYAGIVLPPGGGVQPQMAIGDYVLALQRVTPYPVSTGEIPARDYRVTLLLSPRTREDTPPPQTTPAPPSTLAAQVDEAFELRVGETANLAAEGLQVQFDAVQMDSRCPLDVMCAWSGVVGLAFVATGPDGTTAKAVLGGYAGQDGAVKPAMETGTAPHMWVDGYTIAIQRVTPYPAHHDQSIAPEDYVATLVVTKAATEEASQSVATPTAIAVDGNGLPLLCLSEVVLTQFIAGGTQDTPVQSTPPVAAAALEDREQADQLCAALFGDHWHSMEPDDMDLVWPDFVPVAGVYWLWDWDADQPVEWNMAVQRVR